MDAAGRFAEYLAKRRLKMTRERRGILEKVLALRGHFDVDQLHAVLGEAGLPVSRATLYRTLPRLVEAGLVHKVEMAQGQARYEPMFGRHHHDHMVCLGCGRIFEFESRDIERIQQDVCRRKRFTMTDHTHQIRGYCEACARPSSAAPEEVSSAGGHPGAMTSRGGKRTKRRVSAHPARRPAAR